MVEILKLVLNFMSESPILTFFLAPFVFTFVILIIAAIVDIAESFASIFKPSKGEKK